LDGERDPGASRRIALEDVDLFLDLAAEPLDQRLGKVPVNGRLDLVAELDIAHRRRNRVLQQRPERAAVLVEGRLDQAVERAVVALQLVCDALPQAVPNGALKHLVSVDVHCRCPVGWLCENTPRRFPASFSNTLHAPRGETSYRPP